MSTGTATRFERPIQRPRATRFGARVWAAVVSDTGARVTSYVVGLLAWQIIGALYERVPGPIEVVQFLADEFESGDVWPNFYATADRFLWGLAIAFVAGVLLGLIIGMWPLARALLKDTMMVGRSEERRV